MFCGLFQHVQRSQMLVQSVYGFANLNRGLLIHLINTENSFDLVMNE